VAVDAALRSGNKWDQFIFWCDQFRETGEWAKQEREYKIPIADRLVSARESLFAGDGQWVELVSKAIHYQDGAIRNNLTDWRQMQPLERWFASDTGSAELALRFLWNESLPVRERFNQFAEIVIAQRVKAPISETAFLHMAMGVEECPPFRSGAMERVMNLTGYPSPRDASIKSGDIGGRYKHFLQFLGTMQIRARERGVDLNDHLEAQSIAWVVTEWQPIEGWPPNLQAAFRSYVGAAA
jgi:hypothetical protein